MPTRSLARPLAAFGSPVLALLLGSLTLAPPARAQVTTQPPETLPPDTTQGEDDGETQRLRVSPTVFPPFGWLPTEGFGIGVGATVSNLFRPGTALLATALVSQHVGQYGLAFTTRDPLEPGFGFLARGFYETTGRRYFYGVGPGSDRDDRIAVEKERLEAELRAGYTLRPRARLRVQAHTRYASDALHGTENLDGGARGRLDAASVANLEGALTRDVTTLASGGDVIFDARNSAFLTQRGALLQAGSVYTTSLNGPDVSFTRTYASANLYRPVPFRDATAAFRAALVTTSGESGEVPFQLLPTLGSELLAGLPRERFAASDVLVVGGELYLPIFDLLGGVAFDAIGGASLYGVYDRITDQFSPAVSFEKRLDPGASSVALRPAVSVGARVYSYVAEGIGLTLQAGFTPEGFALSTFTLVSDLRSLRPVLRGL